MTREASQAGDTTATAAGPGAVRRQAAGPGLGQRARRPSRVISFLAVSAAVMALAAGGQSDTTSSDISPIFPLSADKCAKYDGNAEGSGFSAPCWVTPAKCEQATPDWQQAMREGGVSDAIQFSCN